MVTLYNRENTYKAIAVVATTFSVTGRIKKPTKFKLLKIKSIYVAIASFISCGACGRFIQANNNFKTPDIKLISDSTIIINYPHAQIYSDFYYFGNVHILNNYVRQRSYLL